MQGVRINIIEPRGAAQAAGLVPGDIIIAYNGFETPTDAALLSAIAASRDAGADKVTLSLVRENKRIVIDAPVGPLGVTISAVEFEAPEDKPEDRELSFADREAIKRVIVTTAPSIEGRSVVETLDVVSAECVMGINAFRDVLASVRNIVGGRSGTMQKAMREAKQAAMDDLRAEAYALGGNAVIAARIEYNEFSSGSNGLLMIAAYGTAVTLSER